MAVEPVVAAEAGSAARVEARDHTDDTIHPQWEPDPSLETAGEIEADRVTADTSLPPVDQFFYALSSAADHGLVWLLLGSVRAARLGEPAVALRLGALLGAESILTNGIVKLAFRKVRPQEHFTHDEALPYGMRRPITSSFPSGHAATAFMAAGLLSKGTRLAPAYYTLAALIAYSRVHVRMHHVPDVVGGAALGVVLGAIARRFVKLT
jgi:membrane-associated phospholipid phosphatase